MDRHFVPQANAAVAEAHREDLAIQGFMRVSA